MSTKAVCIAQREHLGAATISLMMELNGSTPGFYCVKTFRDSRSKETPTKVHLTPETVVAQGIISEIQTRGKRPMSSALTFLSNDLWAQAGRKMGLADLIASPNL